MMYSLISCLLKLASCSIRRIFRFIMGPQQTLLAGAALPVVVVAQIVVAVGLVAIAAGCHHVRLDHVMIVVVAPPHIQSVKYATKRATRRSDVGTGWMNHIKVPLPLQP
jgi:hypothetical protein